jgi:outer membrane protein assembly factor BamB
MIDRRWTARLACLLLVAAACLAPLAAWTDEPELDPLDIDRPAAVERKKAESDDAADALDDLLEGKDRGTRFVLVNVADPDEELAGRMYWRRLPGVVAAETAPTTFRLAGTDVIVPRLPADAADEDAAGEPAAEDGAAVESAADAAPVEEALEYPTEGWLKLENGRHLLTPGDLPIEVRGGVPSSKHPAIKVIETDAGQEVRILCAPVGLQIADEYGVPAPGSITLGWEEESLLRQDANYSRLVVWLPVGCRYSSNLGTFELSATGELKATRSAAGVKVADGFLRKSVAVPPAKAARRETTVAGETLTASVPPDSVQSGDASIPEANWPRYRLFVPTFAAPGEPAWVAISRPEYQAATGRAFDAADFRGRVEYGARTELRDEPQTLTEGMPPGEAVGPAGDALRAEASDLAWLQVPIPATVAGPVSFQIEGRQSQPVRGTVLVAQPGDGLWLAPHRWRTAFAQTEIGVYHVFVPRGAEAMKGTILAQPIVDGDQPRPIELGRIDLPAVKDADFDSRLCTLKAKDLPAGEYQLWIEAGERRSNAVPLRVVAWLPKSPFLVHSMSGCTTCWPTSEAGLQTLQDAGLEMATATGAWSMLYADVPAIDAALAARWGGLPAELAMRPVGNDYLLERMLRHELRLIDLAVVREAGLYNEGLSYHHSYAPSVERMVRRMQVFTQQTADYASFWGVNYAWFPQLYGYAEGGVATDAHVADRNRVLDENVRAAGHEPLSAEELVWYHEHKFSDDPAERERALALMRRAVDYWRTSHNLGWGRHNRIYNDAIRQVRPDAVCTLFDNAGHDEGKRARDEFGDMAATCYESYTDYGDWPMSSGFTVDWARANNPGQPVWLTTCWGASSEGKMKSLFHAFARGLAGGGVPLQANYDLAELARRGTGMKFLGQYGALSKHAVPDRRVAILSRAAAQALTPRGMWCYHALYCHLTRLGFPPILIADEEAVKDGFPPHVEVLCLAREQQPIEPELEQAIERFVARGGRVIAAGAGGVSPDGAIVVDQPLTHIWELDGFMPTTHEKLWEQFQGTWRAALEDALKQAKIEPLATTDPDRGYVLTLDAGPVRYVAVIADAAGTHSNEFLRQPELPVSIAGDGWHVRDLVKQKSLDVAEEDGQSRVAVDLSTEPTTLLAAYRHAPEQVAIELPSRMTLGTDLVVSCRVAGAGDAGDLGAVPVAVRLIGPEGRERHVLHRAAGDVARIPLAAHDAPGTWQVAVQELLTGITAEASIDVVASKRDVATIGPVGDVHLPNADHLRRFAARKGEKLILIEPEQHAWLPIAQRLAERLTSAGVPARLWQVQPQDYDTIPVRWYPRPEDSARLERIAAGELIGYRENMTPYIDRAKRAHVPQRGGYAEISPPYMVGRDCIVFSGGRLAESLRAVTTWMDTPHSPGRGQGRLVACFSPFMADRMAVAVVGTDADGLGQAADALAELLTSGQPDAAEVAAASAVESAPALKPAKVKARQVEVDRPYGNYSPIQRIERLLATADGRAVVLLNGEADNVALVGADGGISATVRLEELLPRYARIDDQGRLVHLSRRVLATHPAWHTPTEIELSLDTIAADGTRAAALRAYRGSAEGLPPDYEGGFVASPGGGWALARRSGLWSLAPGGDGWRHYDDLPHIERRFQALFPRWPVGAAFSPDGRYLLCTFDSRPPTGAFSIPAPRPMGAETVLIDLETGERVWALRDEDFNRSTYAAHSGFAAVSRDGERTALADCDGTLWLIDREGQVLFKEQTATGPMDLSGRLGPAGGVGVWMDPAGRTAAFGVANVLVIVHDGRSVRVPAPGLTSAAVSTDGRLVFAALSGGKLQAFAADGMPTWSATPGGTGNHIATCDAGVLVATGEGRVVLFDAAGQQVRTTDVAQAADAGQHPVRDSAGFVELSPPIDYRQPGTLEIAQRVLAAGEVAAWKPTGKGVETHGRKFYTVDRAVELSAAAEGGETFLHLVYRRPESNKSLRVVTRGADGEEEFDLDLPTPEYRIVDLPIRGEEVSVRLELDGPVEIAECTLWSYRWPGPNLAFVQPPDLEAVGDLAAGKKPPVKSAADDLLEELEGKPAETGAMKELKIYWPNTDPDRIAGFWRRPPVDPTQIVDARRFGGGKLPPWADQYGAYMPARGGFFTLDFAEPVAIGLVATYDRVTKQSEVCRNLAIFTAEEPDELTTGRSLAGGVENDQFWRLFPLPEGEVPSLGIHAFSGSTRPVGLSEVEAYPSSE